MYGKRGNKRKGKDVMRKLDGEKEDWMKEKCVFKDNTARRKCERWRQKRKKKNRI